MKWSCPPVVTVCCCDYNVSTDEESSTDVLTLSILHRGHIQHLTVRDPFAFYDFTSMRWQNKINLQSEWVKETWCDDQKASYHWVPDYRGGEAGARVKDASCPSEDCCLLVSSAISSTNHQQRCGFTKMQVAASCLRHGKTYVLWNDEWTAGGGEGRRGRWGRDESEPHAAVQKSSHDIVTGPWLWWCSLILIPLKVASCA